MSQSRVFRALPPGIAFWRPSTLIATWFGVGLMRRASGTWGSLAAIPFALAIASASGPTGLGLAALAVTLVGIWAAHVVCEEEKDSSVVVVDEVAGQWLALVPAGLDPWLILAAFVLFRVFDVAKPWPISWIDRNTRTGFGVMIDDIVAGLIASALVMALSSAPP